GEALGLRGHLVRPDLDVEKLVIAVIVGLRRRGDPGGEVFQSYRRLWQNGAVRITDRAEHYRSVELGERGRRSSQDKKISQKNRRYAGFHKRLLFHGYVCIWLRLNLVF